MLASVAATAQVATGTYQFGTFDNLGADTINVGNLNAHIVIPVINKPGRGLPFYYNLAYDSAVWSPTNASGTPGWTLAQGAGWHGITEMSVGYMSYSIATSNGRIREGVNGPTVTCPVTTYSNFVYHDTFGVAHKFGGITQNYSNQPQQCNPPDSVTSFTATAGDSSGYSVSVTNYSHSVVTNKNGWSFVPPGNTASGAGTVTDNNGNQITTDGAGHFTDTLGLTALTVDTSGSNQTFTYTDTSGNPQTYTVTYTSQTVQTNFGCASIAEYPATSTALVSSIALPDGTSYSFTYEPTPGIAGAVTGRLASVTLPTGGVITYTYAGANNGISCTDGGPLTLTRKMTSISPNVIRTYVRTPATASSHTSVTDGNGNDLEYDFVPASATVGPNVYETQRKVYNGAGTGTPVLAKLTCYNQASQSSCVTAALTPPITAISTYATYDGLVQNGSDFQYDTYGDLTFEQDYDFGTSTSRGSSLQGESIIYNQSGPVGLPAEIRGTLPGSTATDTVYTYDDTTPSSTSGLPQHIAVSGPRGNLTTVVQYLTAPGGVQAIGASTIYTYDDAGQVRSQADTNNNTTTYTYDGTYDAYLTNISYPTVGTVTQTSQNTWDFNSGALLSTTVNGNKTSYTYDKMLRPLSASYPDGGYNSWTYNLGSDTASSSVLHASGVTLTTTTTLDPYGRTVQTASPAASGTSLVNYTYDGNGNLASTSNPYSSNGGTPVYTTASYDVLGRPLAVHETDCSGTNCSTVTSVPLGQTQTITDEAGHPRKLTYDGVGRPTQVLEADASNNPTIETDYAYFQNYNGGTQKTLGSYQTIVTQKGGSTNSTNWLTRTFTYDLMERMVSSKVPESGLTTFSYFAPGGTFCSGSPSNLCSRTDARGAIATYSYDALNRPTGIVYTTSGSIAATPSITYSYDQGSFNGLTISNGVGHRTGMTDGSGTTAWSFDTRGRAVAMRKTINGVTLQANYNYNPDGTVNWLQDYSGDTFTYSYNGAGQPTGISDSLGNSYASSATYNPAGQLTALSHQLTSGSAYLQRTFGYNQRLQPLTIQATVNGGSLIQSLTLNYAPPPHNNGNVMSIANNMDSTGNRSQTFYYDQLNRLTQAGDVTHWGEQYTYDNFGNMVQKQTILGSGNSFSVSANTNNQLSNLQYDGAGEVTLDEFNNQFKYDADGQIITGGGATLLYDGKHNRVAKTVAGTTTLYWPDPRGNVLDESNASATAFGQQVYFGGLKVWSQDTDGNGRFLFTDHLGSTRVTANASGTVLDDIDYKAFGEIAANYGNSPSANHYLFTGYESDDAASNTYYANRRNHSAYMGRFSRPDPYFGSYDFTNPQSLNRYAYVQGNPLKFVDPSGLDLAYNPSDGCWDDWDDATNTLSGSLCGFYSGVPGGGGSGTQGFLPGGGGGGGEDPGNGPHYTNQDACAADAVLNNGLSLLLDAASLFNPEDDAAGLLAAGGALGYGMAVNFASFMNSAMSDDAGSPLGMTSSGLAVAGFLQAPIAANMQGVVSAAATSAMSKIGSGLGVISLGMDAYQTGKTYNNCMAELNGGN